MKKVTAYKVASSSMVPTLELGELVFLENMPFEKLDINDIIGIKCSNKMFIHRIVGIHTVGVYYVTKGDNNDTQDYLLLDCENYIGKAVYVMRNNEMISLYNGEKYEVTKKIVANEMLYIGNVEGYKIIFDGVKCVILNVTQQCNPGTEVRGASE